MRVLFVLVVWLANLAAAAGGQGGKMAAEDDVIHLATMAAPPWRPSAHEQAAADHASFEACEKVVQLLVRRNGRIAHRTYTTSRRWGDILRVKVISDGEGSPTLVTCWTGADGHASVVVKVDDGAP